MKLTNQTNKLVELGFIYALLNPENDEMFYIGASESSPKDRLKGHYYHFKEYLEGKRGKTKKFEYFEKFYPQLVKIKLLEIVQNDYLYQIEQKYIQEYSIKYPLVNQTIGGEGGDTFTLQETVDKIRISELISKQHTGKTKPEGFGENLSKKRMGSQNPMAGKSDMGWVIIFNSDDDYIKLCKAPFEITEFLDSELGIENHKLHAGRVGNISKKMRIAKNKICKSSGYIFKSFDICSKEIQDIVCKDYESKS